MDVGPKFKKFLFVINPISGDLDKQDFTASVETFAEKNGLEIFKHFTTGQDDEKEIETSIRDFDPEVVVAVGGDGTVNMVAKLVAGTGRVLAIIPMGSGNGLAKDLEIPQNNPDKALSVLSNPRLIAIDTLTANDFFFLHLADIGFNARIVRLFSGGKKRGLFSYIKYTIKEFFKYKTSKYYIDSDYGQFKGNAFMITIANSNQFGSNLTINPHGKFDDGIFEVIIIKRFPRIESFRLFFQLLLRRIDFSPYCIILKCRKAIIECKRKKTMQYDGEIAGQFKRINVEIHHQNLKVLVPA